MLRESKHFPLIIPLAWLTALMLTPNTLALLGNLVGVHQGYLGIWLLLGACVYILNVRSYRALFKRQGPDADTSASFRTAWGDLPALLIPLSGRFVTTVFAGTGLLVTAGFVFNEVFLYWFPNFAFAFILLGVLMAIQLFGPSVAAIFQVAFSATAIAGLILLSISGLVAAPADLAYKADVGAAFDFRAVFLTLWLWIGFDLLYVNSRPEARDPGHQYRTIVGGLVAITVIFGLWGYVSLQHVEAGRLAESTIAHTLTARKILGQPGRIIIGLVAIAGTCAAVNALFTSISRMMRSYARQGLIPSPGGLFEKRPAVTVLFAGLVIAALMASGVAGTEAVDTFLRAGLLLWMLNYAVVHLTVLRLSTGAKSPASSGAFWEPAAGAAILLAGIAVLMLSDPDRRTLLVFLAFSVGFFLLLSLIGLKVNRPPVTKTQPARNNR
ncbi:MAG: hypothetical protein PVI00_07675 [Desulfobacterales bacterium]|jgi:amino acid transporter